MTDATENGRWVKRQQAEHYCKPPLNPNGVCTGDEWQCSTCNKILIVTVHPDQRDGSYLSWVFSNGIPWDRYKKTDT